MNDEWLKTVVGLMAQIIITVYSKEESNGQDTLVSPAVNEDELPES